MATSTNARAIVAVDGEVNSSQLATVGPKLDEFKYQQVDSANSRFRLFSLHAATEKSMPLICTMLDSSLEAAPSYEAVSYVWGAETSSKPIFIREDGDKMDEFATEPARCLELRITPNLDCALRALRQRDCQRLLWVDAICIDQTNTKERSEQVLLMGRIYSQCTRDLVWLGADAQRIGDAMDLVQTLVPDAVHSRKLSEFSEHDWANIAAMFGANSVWNRVWIVQEFYCAPKILLCCEGRSLDWEVVVDMIEDNAEFKDHWVSQVGGQLFETVHRCFANISVFHTIRHELFRTERIMSRSLMSLVMMFGSWGVTKSEDNIYGLLNLASDAGDFPVDYSKSLNDIAIDLAEHMIVRKGSLLILSAALGDPFTQLKVSKRDQQFDDLPSWAMSLSKPIPSESGLTMSGQTPYNACGKMDKAVCHISSNRKFLVVSGRHVGTVESLEDVGELAEGENPKDRWARDVKRWAPKDGHKWKYPYSEESILNAYWRTITADRHLDKRITQDHGPEFYVWYQTLAEREPPVEQIVLPGWRFGLTKRGHFCFLPPAAMIGDVIAIFFGAKVPYLLRPTGIDEDPPTYILIGEAYVHGLMDGQMKMADDEGKLALDVFIIH